MLFAREVYKMDEIMMYIIAAVVLIVLVFAYYWFMATETLTHSKGGQSVIVKPQIPYLRAKWSMVEIPINLCRTELNDWAATNKVSFPNSSAEIAEAMSALAPKEAKTNAWGAWVPVGTGSDWLSYSTSAEWKYGMTYIADMKGHPGGPAWGWCGAADRENGVKTLTKGFAIVKSA